MAEKRKESAPAQARAGPGLRWSSDQEPGLRRARRGRGFAYRDAAGEPVTNPEVKARIRSLVIPPAWTGVWICPDPQGHIQATGRDGRGRKQYIYHSDWSRERSRSKFQDLAAFAGRLPAIRAAVDRDLGLPGLPRRKVLALVVKLMEQTLARVGNVKYARVNQTYGLTTLRDEHLDESCAPLCLRYTAKGGRERRLRVPSRRLAALVRRCQDLPGQRLFAYEDEAGIVRAVDSSDVNAYLREIGGPGVTAKVFRTWGATVLAAREFAMLDPPANARDGKRKATAVMRTVAARLGNTPAMARGAYVHPAVIEAFLSGSLPVPVEIRYAPHDVGLSPAETAVARLLARDDPRGPDNNPQGGKPCRTPSGKEASPSACSTSP